MPLEFDERRLLRPGVQDATLEEVEEHFARFQRTDRRRTLFQKLKEYAAALQQAELKGSLIIDGSFIMPTVDRPEDIDLVLVLPEDWDMTADLRPYQYNLVSKRRVKQAFGFDVFIVVRGSSEEHKWVTFFGQVNPKWCSAFGWPHDATKGLVRIPL
jgi:hypothetical protein